MLVSIGTGIERLCSYLLAQTLFRTLEAMILLLTILLFFDDFMLVMTHCVHLSYVSTSNRLRLYLSDCVEHDETAKGTTQTGLFPCVRIQSAALVFV